MKSKLLKIPTLIGVAVLVIAVAAGVALIQSRQIFKLGASPESEPKNVKITNINENSFSVSWTTDKEVSGVLKWGTTSANLVNSESDELKSIGTIHYASVRGLSPSTTYFFKISSGGRDYDNNGNVWSAKTGPGLGNPNTSETISGTVLTATGSPATNIIIYVSSAGTSTLSTTTSSNGSWVIPLTSIRLNNLEDYKQISESDIIDIFAQAGSLGIASAQIYSKSAKPTPPIILGQTHDFKDLPPSSDSQSPGADITSSDEEIGAYSRFDVPDDIPQNDDSTVSIESVDNGELITTTKPEFFGDGPTGTKINIKIESSTPINGSAIIGSSGSWRWSPPSQLAPGNHKITLSWTDENGVIQTIVKNFVVQAAEDEPAFESTPSGSPRASSNPAASSSPSASATSSATPFPHPESGIGTSTTILLVLGFLLISTSSFFYAFSKENYGN